MVLRVYCKRSVGVGWVQTELSKNHVLKICYNEAMTKNKSIWFKARRYGWGWTPVSWQGWVILFVWAGLFGGQVAWFNIAYPTGLLAPIASIVVGLIMTGILLWITYSTGETPGWQWGNQAKK